MIRCGDSVLEISPGKAERLPISKSHHFGRLVGATAAEGFFNFYMYKFVIGRNFD